VAATNFEIRCAVITNGQMRALRADLSEQVETV
jgi:hypothetical protein